MPEVKNLEGSLTSEPDDLNVRLKLIGYYGSNDKANKERIKHVLWMINQFPASDVWLNPELHISSRARNNLDLNPLIQGWLQQVEQNAQNGKIFANAGHFLFLIDENLALDLLEKAEYLTPDDITIPDSISNIYFKRFRDAHEEDKNNFAKLALESSKRALKLQEKEPVNLRICTGPFLLETAAECSLYLSKFEDAKRYASRMKELGYLAFSERLLKRIAETNNKLKRQLND